LSGPNRKKARKKKNSPWYESNSLSGLLLLAVAVYLGLSLTGGTSPWWEMLRGGTSVDLINGNSPGGPVGSAMSVALHMVFGAVWCWVFPLVLAMISISFIFQRQQFAGRLLLRAVPLWLATASWVAQSGGPLGVDNAPRFGGVVGFYIARGFHSLFGLGGGRIFLSLFLLVVLIILFRPWLGWVPGLLHKISGVSSSFGNLFDGVGSFFGQMSSSVAGFFTGLKPASPQRKTPKSSASSPQAPNVENEAEQKKREPRKILFDEPEPEVIPAAVAAEDVEQLNLSGATGEFHGEREGETEFEQPAKTVSKPKKPKKKRGPVTFPGIELMTPADPDTTHRSTMELDTAADLLESTLKAFNVEGQVKNVRPGPVVTTFEFQPGTGVRVNQIVQRSDDLALAMKARTIRMEAPIPGRDVVGIEIPNPTAKVVRLREVMEQVVNTPRNPLTVVLGKDVMGRPVSMDLASLPHLLVAGSTGSGKSVCLNAIISNLLMHNDPSRLRMILIDPKMLEMNVYDGIPHLLLPVVTDPKEALKALNWLVAQMEYRYKLLAKQTVRNIEQYNEKVERGEVFDGNGEKITEIMPYYLTIVDELADLMMQMGNDIELPITRIAQKARAVGLHLILATQRPSVNVLTGVIKANIPCRIAFRVIQRNDSRTILDTNGAEQLLGRGDMLYLQPGRALPVRVHGAFIDVGECEAITRHWQGYKDLTEEISLNQTPAGGTMHTGEDDLFEAAMQVVVLAHSGSTSLLQHRLRVGYTRAGRLMDMLEEAGVVGPFTGSKARDVLVKPEDLPDSDED
jgi:DNA segregation ATPase FtsK/SpoIIIE, S-DNA-T family